jgi:hypothetical protein
MVEFRNDVQGPIELRLDEKGEVQFIHPDSGHALAVDGLLRVTRDERVLSLTQLESIGGAA